ncbi:MAG: InlB B-repeat-containing protein, partial [Oscillospiraceae bacterium]|jgi:hypothetical protein|nr:InlB B-repeat-containing protein [Oscillospiraceae bacterium]
VTVTTTPWTIPPEATASPAANGTFAANTAYRFAFTLNAGSASTFPDALNDLTVKINGITATVTGASGAWNRTVYVDFPATDPVAQRAQTLFVDHLNRVIGAGDFDLSNWAVSSAGTGGGTIVYSVVDADTTGASISGTALSVTSRGEAVIRASSLGNANYLPAEATFILRVGTPPYTITFDANGGTVTPVTATTLGSGKLNLTELPTPTHSTDSFEGWFTAADGGDAVTLDTVFDDDATVYAHWSSPVTQIRVADNNNMPLPAMVSIARNSTLKCSITVNQGANPAHTSIVWTSSDASFAQVDQDGLVTVFNKMGMAVLTARDSVTGFTHSIVLRIT